MLKQKKKQYTHTHTPYAKHHTPHTHTSFVRTPIAYLTYIFTIKHTYKHTYIYSYSFSFYLTKSHFVLSNYIYPFQLNTQVVWWSVGGRSVGRLRGLDVKGGNERR